MTKGDNILDDILNGVKKQKAVVFAGMSDNDQELTKTRLNIIDARCADMVRYALWKAMQATDLAAMQRIMSGTGRSAN